MAASLRARLRASISGLYEAPIRAADIHGTAVAAKEKMMNIGTAARLSGMPVKTIRYYDEVGLLTTQRGANGYRDYGEDDVHRLRFVRRARSLGFSLQECRQLLALYSDKRRASAEVKAIASEKLAEMDRKIAELTALRATLGHFVATCHGDDRPDCPIMDGLSGEPSGL
jgi:MerR family transcriptional regulator, copper efflux regulator